MMTKAVLAGALIFVGVLGFLTIAVIVDNGPDILTFMSMIVLALIGFGIFSAMRSTDE
jgi:hypothetical protein